MTLQAHHQFRPVAGALAQRALAGAAQPGPLVPRSDVEAVGAANASFVDIVVRIPGLLADGLLLQAPRDNPGESRVVYLEAREDLQRLLSALAGPAGQAPATDAHLTGEMPASHEIADAGASDTNSAEARQLAIRAETLGLDVPAGAPASGRRPPCPLPKWRLKRVLAYIEENLPEQITLPALAAAAGLSRMYFASQFRMATGYRPHHYVLKKRIERAQERLVADAESLVEIALSVGFQSQAHFTTTFKKLVGETPHRWRREQRRCS
jgi:AraC family transcriptional regulator